MIGPLTLLSDFGYRDPFVGIMKGVILGICPDCRLVDLCHGIPPQDVQAGGLALAAAWSWFPEGSIHCAVVDPGVGSGRRALVASCAGHRFVLPDNGLLDLALAGRRPDAVHAVDPALPLLPAGRSQTFHGRDVFAPLAAHLAAGMRLADLGPVCPDWQRLSLPAPHPEGGRLVGRIIAFDGFGNALTDLPADCQAPIRCADLDWPLVTCYAAVAPGGLLAVVGSTGRIELAVNSGSAQTRHGLAIGTTVSATAP